MWPGRADNDESSSPPRASEDQGERGRMSEERAGMRREVEGTRWRGEGR